MPNLYARLPPKQLVDTPENHVEPKFPVISSFKSHHTNLKNYPAQCNHHNYENAQTSSIKQNRPQKSVNLHNRLVPKRVPSNEVQATTEKVPLQSETTSQNAASERVMLMNNLTIEHETTVCFEQCVQSKLQSRLLNFWPCYGVKKDKNESNKVCKQIEIKRDIYSRLPKKEIFTPFSEPEQLSQQVIIKIDY